MTRRFLFLLIAALLPVPIAGQATPAARPTCDAAEFRAFDFWLGDWTVTGPNGQAAGGNVISSVSDGCALLEQWTAADGSTGTSLNWYDPAARTWNQRWVGAGQSILELEGGMVDGAMELRGERPTGAGGTAIDRIRWTPAADGSVRQHWQVSTDGGATWTDAFDGTYRPAKPMETGAGAR